MNKTNANKRSRTFTKTEIGALADAFDKDLNTIRRWIATNDDRLTSERANRCLAEINRSAPARKTL